MHHNFLFDLDQTLLDFHASEYIGLKTVVNARGFEFTDECYNYFKVRNKELWLKLEKKEITRTQLFETRFRLLFEKLGADTAGIDLLAVNDDFIIAMSRNGVPMEGASEFLHKLKESVKDARIYIITNGVVVNAMGRIKSTKLDKYLDDIFVSETIGYNKPAVEYFDTVLEKIGEPKESCIVIGDSLSSDILGAKNAGITSCWFMPTDNTKKVRNEYNISYSAGSFDELYEALKSWAEK